MPALRQKRLRCERSIGYVLQSGWQVKAGQDLEWTDAANFTFSIVSSKSPRGRSPPPPSRNGRIAKIFPMRASALLDRKLQRLGLCLPGAAKRIAPRALATWLKLARESFVIGCAFCRFDMSAEPFEGCAEGAQGEFGERNLEPMPDD